ncbi:hypothetical protein FPQ18DRAFT_162513 [Pyronema domesticum]|nr:hypothetical protein FPQ18DRAFT_162513 [Pyronema domesticum]
MHGIMKSFIFAGLVALVAAESEMRIAAIDAPKPKSGEAVYTTVIKTEYETLCPKGISTATTHITTAVPVTFTPSTITVIMTTTVATCKTGCGASPTEVTLSVPVMTTASPLPVSSAEGASTRSLVSATGSVSRSVVVPSASGSFIPVSSGILPSNSAEIPALPIGTGTSSNNTTIKGIPFPASSSTGIAVIPAPSGSRFPPIPGNGTFTRPVPGTIIDPAPTAPVGNSSVSSKILSTTLVDLGTSTATVIITRTRSHSSSGVPFPVPGGNSTSIVGTGTTHVVPTGTAATSLLFPSEVPEASGLPIPGTVLPSLFPTEFPSIISSFVASATVVPPFPIGNSTAVLGTGTAPASSQTISIVSTESTSQTLTRTRTRPYGGRPTAPVPESSIPPFPTPANSTEPALPQEQPPLPSALLLPLH